MAGKPNFHPKITRDFLSLLEIEFRFDSSVDSSIWSQMIIILISVVSYIQLNKLLQTI